MANKFFEYLGIKANTFYHLRDSSRVEITEAGAIGFYDSVAPAFAIADEGKIDFEEMLTGIGEIEDELGVGASGSVDSETNRISVIDFKEETNIVFDLPYSEGIIEFEEAIEKRITNVYDEGIIEFEESIESKLTNIYDEGIIEFGEETDYNVLKKPRGWGKVLVDETNWVKEWN